MNNVNPNAEATAVILKKVDFFETREIAPVMFPEISSPLERIFFLFIKRLFDVVISSLLIVVVLSWLTPLIALLIKIDSRGPVFFFQKRNKRYGKLFTCIKFRTMIVNTHADVLAACADDTRITKPGKFLRRLHIDELPQLFNVFWGDMSLIGPRPYMISDNQRYEKCVERYNLRHKVKPGMTGLAQATGHSGFIVNEDEMKRRVQLDLKYIENWSMGMDIKILLKTSIKLFISNS